MAIRYLVPKGKHLPVTGADGKPDHRLMGAAWAALFSNFRGRGYEGPDKEGAKERLRALYKSEGIPTPSTGKSAVAAIPDTRDLFVPISKMYDGPDGFFIDGILVAEEPDRVGEIWDYASSKPEVLKWAEEAKLRTAGKSAGNLRSMHGQVATGRFLSVEPDDAQRLFKVHAEVVDEQDKEKCRKGVYSGFSIKAPYARRWPDPHRHKYTRWTNGPIIEGSLVDLPCIPGATFNIKVVTPDRSSEWEETRRFIIPDDVDPWDLELDALTTREAAKSGRGQAVEVTVTLEEDEMDYKVIAEKRGLAPDAFKLALEDALTEIAGKSAAAKCMKSAEDCDDADCPTHGSMKARKGDPDTGDVQGKQKDGAPKQPSGDGIKGMICIGETSDGVKVYREDPAAKRANVVEIKSNAGSGSFTAADVAAAVAEKIAPFSKAFEQLTETVAILAGQPLPSGVAVRGGEHIDKTKDGVKDASKAAGGDPAEKSASDLAKEGKPVDAVKAIHAAGPSMVLSNRGIQRPA